MIKYVETLIISLYDYKNYINVNNRIRSYQLSSEIKKES